MTSCKKALENWACVTWAKKKGVDPTKETIVKILALTPPIKKLDSQALSTLKNCERLSLSTQAIDKMVPLNNLPKLRILSLGRNRITRIEQLHSVAASLEQLWISYNHIGNVDGVLVCTKLTTLYIGNNKIQGWAEVEKLRQLTNLRDIVLFGNPIYEDYDTAAECRIAVLRCIPQLTKIDGRLVNPQEREAAAKADY